MVNPLISCYTIIGRNVKLLDQWVRNVKDNAGLTYGTDYEIDLVLWNPEPDIVEYVQAGGYRYTEYRPGELFPGRQTDYVFDLYNCWNQGYEMSRCEFVFRSGSDQIMSKGFLANSMKLILDYEGLSAASEEESIKRGDGDPQKTAFYHLYTMESWDGSLSAYGRPCSRHVMPRGWWDDLYAPDFDKFDKFCESLAFPALMTAEEYPLMLPHATRGWIPHCVGASWIQRRDTYERLGPMWNHVGPNGLTGDVEYFDRGDVAGIPSLLIGDAFTLHRCKGES